MPTSPAPTPTQSRQAAIEKVSVIGELLVRAIATFNTMSPEERSELTKVSQACETVRVDLELVLRKVASASPSVLQSSKSLTP